MNLEEIIEKMVYKYDIHNIIIDRDNEGYTIRITLKQPHNLYNILSSYYNDIHLYDKDNGYHEMLIHSK